MAIKPVTFQGEENFKSNLYALEVKSRFIDQTHADGYYKGYGDELAATAKTGAITVGSGALVVQGRMIEIETGGADCAVDVSTNRVGYVCVRIETYHLTDSDNVTLVSKLDASLSAITFTQQDTYAAVSETVNRIYELPIYSFAVQNGIITNLVKLINPVEDYATIKALADAASNNASAAAGNAQSAATNATLAQSAANNAASLAAEAKTDAENALAAAQEALTKVVEDMGGTVIYKDGVAIATLEIDFIAKAITYAFECGEAEKARGYTRGGELDRALRRLSQRVMSANFALYADESETARKAQGYTAGGAISKMFSATIKKIAEEKAAIMNTLNNSIAYLHTVALYLDGQDASNNNAHCSALITLKSDTISTPISTVNELISLLELTNGNSVHVYGTLDTVVENENLNPHAPQGDIYFRLNNNVLSATLTILLQGGGSGAGLDFDNITNSDIENDMVVKVLKD